MKISRIVSSLMVIAAVGIPSLSQTTSSPADNPSALIAPDPGGPSQLRVTATDDAFHYRDWQGTPYDGAYTEWWYFNLYDQRQDLEAIFSYQVVDPANVAGLGTAFASAAVYHGSDIVNTFYLAPLSSFEASYSAANVTLGSNRISVLDPSSYRISGASANGRTVHRAAPR